MLKLESVLREITQKKKYKLHRLHHSHDLQALCHVVEHPESFLSDEMVSLDFSDMYLITLNISDQYLIKI